MQKIENRLTVYFDDPFWVGIYERVLDGELEVSKITFGAEPKTMKFWHFLWSVMENFVSVLLWMFR